MCRGCSAIRWITLSSATLSRGSAVLNHTFVEDRPVHKPSSNILFLDGTNGKLISNAIGKAITHALALI